MLITACFSRPQTISERTNTGSERTTLRETAVTQTNDGKNGEKEIEVENRARGRLSCERKQAQRWFYSQLICSP